MTLHAQNELMIPEETARIARAAYAHGNTYMKMRDALGTIYQDQAFAPLFPQHGRPVEARLSPGPDNRDAIYGRPSRSAGGRSRWWTH